MSLINKALRKAQRDRNPPSTSPTDTRDPASYATAPSSGAALSPSLAVGLIVAIAVLFGLVVGLSIAMFRGSPETPRVGAQSLAPDKTPAELFVERLAPPAPEVAPAQTSKTASSVVEQLRIAQEATEAQLRAEIEAAQKAEAAAQKQAEQEKATARQETEPNEAIIEWLSSSRITGVRLAGDASRVILNGEPFSVGDTVSYQLGLKVLVIQESRVLFVDDNGQRYLKRL